MARIDNSKITQVRIGEIRARLIGPRVSLDGRFAYTDEAGVTYGQTQFGVFSKRTWEILRQLGESMELDFAEAITGVAEEPETPGEQADEGEAPFFER
jgi:hypothetical protein